MFAGILTPGDLLFIARCYWDSCTVELVRSSYLVLKYAEIGGTEIITSGRRILSSLTDEYETSQRTYANGCITDIILRFYVLV